MTDIRNAIRSLRATPSFTAVALAVLTLGIGTSTAIFSVVDAVVLRGLPFDDADRLVALNETSTKTGRTSSVAAPNFVDWRAQQQFLQRLIAQRRFNMLLLSLFGVLAIVIAAVGVYGVMAYIVEQRTQEIGVRMALGALPGRILRMVLGRAAVFMTAGLALGLTGAWGLARFVATFLFKVQPHDPVVYGTVALVLLTAGLIAAFVPARRAANVDPLVALRRE